MILVSQSSCHAPSDSLGLGVMGLGVLYLVTIRRRPLTLLGSLDLRVAPQDILHLLPLFAWGPPHRSMLSVLLLLSPLPSKLPWTPWLFLGVIFNSQAVSRSVCRRPLKTFSLLSPRRTCSWLELRCNDRVSS